ncbi:DUF4245 domain-containing protein [Herbiconiux ginsengi]|uniref:DUF4245 domain-containing protein n=1 Tax=Herbiconiux ginsengi TaxID=381665 RepID=A0A1H3SFA7_9MICO|nr:DUF4245 domain-containing protein [Herbiconiux ginsengi]SDZ35799.1 Protein of unknown function [Herbiconiux ginsengi]
MAKSASGTSGGRPIVAELGRPETPEETAARKAEQSRLYRDRKTLQNLLYALLVCVGLVAVIVFLVPRSEGSLLQAVDYQKVAADAQPSMPIALAVPELPEGWTSNAAEIRTSTGDDIVSWYIGLLTPGNDYIGITQALDANPSWLNDQVAKGRASDVVSIGGVDWDVYDNRSTGADVGNAAYALTTESGRATYVVFGTADPADIETVAAALAHNVREQANGASGTGLTGGTDGTAPAGDGEK